ncbi:MAG: nucleotidyl transferase AbiEii/AbiGii toxin family protein [Anaerolineales bacterium]|uniref:nucleotidyl transferase AbiEii/AbiGii toxin family protein n=1 Tax=Candidatus Villigracilis vicinus TaxID=3140679 RepID=UPI0031370BB7|nr:nucleotidyl transferase AbiEii/AbiGii toxin family protein [Anaerolineales bacterium]
MSDLFWNTITNPMREVLRGFMQSELGSQFYLAGGTALSLQIGHRLSVDLDFFSPTEDIPSTREVIEKTLNPFQIMLTDSSWGNLVYIVNNVRVGFYGYGFPLIAPLIETENIRLASIEDVALMKFDALLGRASRKDFYDLYYICKYLSLRELLNKAPQKYPSVRDFEVQVVKRLVFFENAENETNLVLLNEIDWQSVKNFFIDQAKVIEQGWLQ